MDFNSNLDDEQGITFVARSSSQRDPQKERKALTETEAVLPWKRGEEDAGDDKQVSSSILKSSSAGNTVPSSAAMGVAHP